MAPTYLLVILLVLTADAQKRKPKQSKPNKQRDLIEWDGKKSNKNEDGKDGMKNSKNNEERKLSEEVIKNRGDDWENGLEKYGENEDDEDELKTSKKKEKGKIIEDGENDWENDLENDWENDWDNDWENDLENDLEKELGKYLENDWRKDLEKDLEKKNENEDIKKDELVWDFVEIFENIFDVSKGKANIAIEMHNITCAFAERSHYFGDRRNHFIVPNNNDTFEFYKCNFKSLHGTQGTCLLTESLLCDGISACATDECACEGSQVFYCSNGQGCIALEQVCDGQADCMDGSDECVCDSYLNCDSDRNHIFCRTAQQREIKCGFEEKIAKKGTDDQILGLFHCLKTGFTGIGRLEISMSNDYVSWCKNNCKQLSNHCDNIDGSSLTVDTGIESINYTCGIESSIALSADVDVCDGFYDCPNRADEAACANRFYCDEGSKSIPLSKVCDSVPDCGDLTDECQQCARNNLADDKFMISNKYISYYMIVLIFFVIAFNLLGIFGHATKLYYETQRYSFKVNSILCLQLCVYDLLMGIYILIITTKNFQYYGSYCIHDVKWRSSMSCNVAGVIFTFSSHGSLLTALIMGLYRCYTCERMLVHFSPTKLMIGLAMANILIFLSSVVTLFPIQYFDKVFVTAVSFEGNPMIKKGTKPMIDSLIQEYYGYELDPNSFSWPDRLARLSNMTSNPEIFKPTGKFGFFNQSPLCIQNLFSDDMGDGIKLFKIIYVTAIGVMIILFSVSYAWIAVIRLRSAAPSADKSQKAAKEKNNKKTSKKVALIISSQLLAWIPIIIATILSYCNQNVPQDFYEIAAIVLIPVNSLLNPLFHSPMKSFRNISKRSRTAQLSYLTTPRLQKTDAKEIKPENTKPSSEAKEDIEMTNMLVGVDVK